jgi:DnaJ-class molecular chaperone
MAIPMLRVSKWLALGWALFCLERFLPRIYVREHYHIKIKPGYKSGTKIVFEDEQGTGSHGVQVQFVLKEKRHPIYTRVGNDLHVSCVLCPRDARDGCQLQVPSLADEEILLSLQTPQNSKSGDRIRLIGQGWPNRKKTGPGHGDLIVTITVSRWTSKSRILQRSQSWDFVSTIFHAMRKATS